MAFRSGFVSIIGRPNAGKSTLLNALLGQKLAIVTHKPQTTRTRIHGVLEVPLKKKAKGEPGHPAAQVVLVDTPGVHKPETQLDRRMMQEVQDALESRDAVLFIVDVTHRLAKAEAPGEKVKATGRMAMSAAEDDFALSLVKRLDCPVILVLNKIDAVRKAGAAAADRALERAAHVRRCGSDLGAQEGRTGPAAGQDCRVLPEGQRYFPRDQVTDQPERFLVAELIREKILMLTGEEVPYATAVVIERFEEPASLKKMKDGRPAADEDRGGNLLRAHGPEGDPYRQAGRDAEADWHMRRARRSRACWARASSWNSS